MRLHLHPMGPERVDAQSAMALAVACSGLMAILLERFGLLGVCHFRTWTGLPCPTCGGTRCLSALLAGEPLDALQLNPLLMLSALAAVAFVVYAVVGGLLRWPRLSLQMNRRDARVLLLLATLALLANEFYLLQVGV